MAKHKKIYNFIAYVQNRADSDNPFGIKKELITISEKELEELMENMDEEEAVSEYLSDIHAEYGQHFMNVVFEEI